MIWSFSSARMFRQCPRQWYFKACLASARAKDPLRHEVYVLSKLQSVSAWRGNLVDRLISTEIIGSIARRETITKAQLLRSAKLIFDRQLELALRHSIRDSGAETLDEAIAFRSVEYGERPSAEELASAWTEVEVALSNLFEMEQVRGALKAARHLVAQRPLQFEFAGTRVRAVPDLIAFSDELPPLIIDWKVHRFGTRDYRLQLALYALALVRCAPHRDFPAAPRAYLPTDIRLLEAQLLTGMEHYYELTVADFEELEDYIAATGREMRLALTAESRRNLHVTDFPVTSFPELCQRCPFMKLCWEQHDDSPRDERLSDYEPPRTLFAL
jgi:PD-(D/E)XK nuclease superfamily protein